MPNVVVRLPRRDARAQGQQRAGAIERLHLTLTLSTIAWFGGLRYKPTISRTFSTNCGSADSLKVSTRCACSPKVRQMRAIVAFERPRASPRLRVLHSVRVGGGASSVRVMTSTTRSSVTVRGTPGRGSSFNPASRRTRKRSRHVHTQLLDTPNCAATARFVRPSAQASTICERRATRCAVVGRRAH